MDQDQQEQRALPPPMVCLCGSMFIVNPRSKLYDAAMDPPFNLHNDIFLCLIEGEKSFEQLWNLAHHSEWPERSCSYASHTTAQL